MVSVAPQSQYTANDYSEDEAYFTRNPHKTEYSRPPRPGEYPDNVRRVTVLRNPTGTTLIKIGIVRPGVFHAGSLGSECYEFWEATLSRFLNPRRKGAA